MKLKMIVAIIGLVLVSAVLLAATVSALSPNDSSGNAATSSQTNGNYPTGPWGPHAFGDDHYNYGEGGMMNGWAPFSQGNSGTLTSFGNDWGWHE